MARTDSATSEFQPAESGVYARIVDGLRDRALTTQELASVVGVNPRQISNWASGSHIPKGARRDRLLEVEYIVNALRDVYTREGADIWLHGRKRSLGGQRPIDLMREGRFQTVLHAVERLRTGAM
jgi:transcriptional regulator with XRE-family HTH domain